MTREEAIKWMEEAIQDTKEFFDQCSPALQKELIEQKEVFELAISALRSGPQPGKPLTLEQLREMDGQPVWIVEFPDWGHWELSEDAEDYLCDRDTDLYGFMSDLDGEAGSHELGWLAYPYPPAHIDRSKWEACELCSLPDGKSASRLILAETCNGEAKYCPRCGRPLTDEAWAELEQRLQGMPLPEPPEEG